MAEITVTIIKPEHRRRINRLIGVIEAHEKLKESQDIYGKTPGWNAAITIIEGLACQLKSEAMVLNVTAAAKAGIDLATHRVYSIDGDNIICVPIEQEEVV